MVVEGLSGESLALGAPLSDEDGSVEQVSVLDKIAQMNRELEEEESVEDFLGHESDEQLVFDAVEIDPFGTDRCANAKICDFSCVCYHKLFSILSCAMFESSRQ